MATTHRIASSPPESTRTGLLEFKLGEVKEEDKAEKPAPEVKPDAVDGADAEKDDAKE